MLTKMYDIFSRRVLGKNTKYTTQSTVLDQMSERRPLPIGATEFDEWADRIIGGALVTADKDSQKFALANMILQLNPHDSHKEDAFFIQAPRALYQSAPLLSYDLSI